MTPVPREEIAELMRFVAKKSKHAKKKKMSLREMCRQFKTKTGSTLTVDNLMQRIESYRDRIHEMTEFDMDTRARMMMAVRATVDDDFLRERVLRKEAEVKVDDQHRIIRYKKKHRSDGPSTSPLAKRKRDSEAGTSGERKRNRTASEDDDKESKSAEEASSDREGSDVPQGNDEQLWESAEIDQKPANLFHNSPNNENNRHEEQDENRVPEDRAPENPAASGGDLRSDGASTSSKRKIDSENDSSGEIKKLRAIQIADNLFQNALGVGHRLDDQPPIKIEYEEKEQDEQVDLKPLIDTQGIDGSGPASDIVVIHDQENQERIDVEETRKPSTSVRDLLILLRGTLLPLKSSYFNGLRRKIEAKIQKLSNGKDLEFPLEIINMAFDPCLVLLIRHATSNPEEESTSLLSFLHFLQSSTCHLSHPSMTPFHEVLEAQIAKFIAHDQRIPIKIVHNAIDAILNFIDP